MSPIHLPATPRLSLLRTRSEHGGYRVTYIELFFDLVFVFAVTQISHLLIEHFSYAGAAKSLLMLLAVWWVWIFTAWATNWINPDRLPVRALLLAMTIVGLVLSASIPAAFDSRGLTFAAAYVLMQVGRTLFCLWVTRGERHALFRSFQRMLAWLVLAGAFWIAGGLVEGALRWGLWIVALGLEFASPSVGFWAPGLGRSELEEWEVEGGHMAERCGLFVMIALGESVLVTGATFAGMVWTSATVTAFASSTFGSIAMWWLYFDTAADAGGRRMSSSRNPGQVARLAYTYIHILLIAGVVVSAAGDQFSLADPAGSADARLMITVLGGPAIYLAGSLLFRWAILGRIERSHLVAMAALGALALASNRLSHLSVMVLSSLILVLLAHFARDASPRGDPTSEQSPRQ